MLYMQICISCCFCGENYVAAIRENQRRYLDRKWRMQLLGVEDGMCERRRMCRNHQPSFVTYLLQQGNFHRLQYGVLCVWIASIFCMYIQYKGCILGRISPSIFLSHMVLHKTANIPHFLCSMFFTDEAVFTRSGVHNQHNFHVSTAENSRSTCHS
jgi:hypothetical protein